MKTTKKSYEQPCFDVTVYEVDDIITASTPKPGENELPVDPASFTDLV